MPLSFSFLFLLLGPCLITSLAEATLTVIHPEEIAAIHTLTARLDMGPTMFNECAPLRAADPLTACFELHNREELNGSIVFIESELNLCSVKKRTENLSKVPNLKGVVTMMKDGSVGSGFFLERVENVQFPAIQVSHTLGMKLYNQMQEYPEILVLLSTPSSNPWQELTWGPYGIVFQLFFTLASLACCFMASWRLRKLIVTSGWALDSPHICLVLQAVGGLERAIYMIQPLQFSKFFFSASVGEILGTITLPCTLTCTFLITFYWHDVVKIYRSKGEKYGSFNLFCLFGIMLIWAMEVLASIMRAFRTSSSRIILDLTPIAYAIITSGAVLLFYIMGARFLYYLRVDWDTLTNFEITRRLELKTIKAVYIVSGIGLMIFLTSALLLFSPVNQVNPESSLTAWSLMYLGLAVTDAAQIFTFWVEYSAPVLSPSEELEMDIID